MNLNDLEKEYLRAVLGDRVPPMAMMDIPEIGHVQIVKGKGVFVNDQPANSEQSNAVLVYLQAVNK